MVVQLLQAPMGARGSEVRRDGVERYVRYEYGDRNPRWMSSQVGSRHRKPQFRPNRLRKTPAVFIARAAKAVASLFF